MIRIEGLRYTAGDFSLRNISLEVQQGEYVVLLGKPGSGKTLLLECVAGLRRLSAGTITIGNRRVERVEPADRGIGYVPQDYALFATRSVRDNIAFGLRARRASPRQREERVAELAQMLGISDLLDRGIHGLSGGERQRVALARALAPRPQVLLLDEPVSALDEETRDGILGELLRIQRETQTTTLHVCHDLTEMRSVAQRTAILAGGRLVQVGTPEEICRRPANAHVARLFSLGTVLSGVACPDGQMSRIELGGLVLRTPGRFEGQVEVCIPAAAVSLATPSPAQNGLAARVRSVMWREATARVELEIGSEHCRAEVPRAEAEAMGLAPGCELGAVIRAGAVHVFPRSEGPHAAEG